MPDDKEATTPAEQEAFAHLTVLKKAAMDANIYFDNDKVMAVWKQRLKIIKLAWAYFDGLHRRPLKVKANKPDDNIILNLCRAIIDDSVAWLFGDPAETTALVMELDEDEQDANPDEEYLREIWGDAGGELFLSKIGEQGAVTGHAFIKIDREMVAGGEVEYRLINVDSRLVEVKTAGDDKDKVEWYKIEWETTDGTRRQLIGNTPGTGDRWVIFDQIRSNKGNPTRRWTLLVDPIEWEFDWSPIIGTQNLPHSRTYYGTSDLEDIAEINDGINAVASNSNRIIRYHAHPRTIGLGIKAKELTSTSVDSLWTVEAKRGEADIFNLEMQSDLKSSFEFLNFLLTMFWDIGRGLDPTSFKDKIGQITNYGLRVLAGRALRKLGNKRKTYGQLIIDVNEHLLEAGGRTPQRTILHWPEPLPEDQGERSKRLHEEVVLGITSKETAAREAGRDWEMEQRRIAQEKRDAATIGSAIVDAFESDNQGDRE